MIQCQNFMQSYIREPIYTLTEEVERNRAKLINMIPIVMVIYNIQRLIISLININAGFDYCGG